MGESASAVGLTGMAKFGNGDSGSLSVAQRRAELVIQCARDLLAERAPAQGNLHLPLSVSEFERALRERYGSSHPELVYRTDSTLERARLERRQFPHLPKVVLRQGAPRRGDRAPARQDGNGAEALFAEELARRSY